MTVINRYAIYIRYQVWSSHGKQWTDWFISPILNFHKTEEGAINELDKYKINDSDSITKLKHEYDIRLIDINKLPVPKITYSKRGRPSIKEKNKQETIHNNYWENYIKEHDYD